jgi:hypothetical protein
MEIIQEKIKPGSIFNYNGIPVRVKANPNREGSFIQRNVLLVEPLSSDAEYPFLNRANYVVKSITPIEIDDSWCNYFGFGNKEIKKINYYLAFEKSNVQLLLKKNNSKWELSLTHNNQEPEIQSSIQYVHELQDKIYEYSEEKIKL